MCPLLTSPNRILTYFLSWEGRKERTDGYGDQRSDLKSQGSNYYSVFPPSYKGRVQNPRVALKCYQWGQSLISLFPLPGLLLLIQQPGSDSHYSLSCPCAAQSAAFVCSVFIGNHCLSFKLHLKNCFCFETIPRHNCFSSPSVLITLCACIYYNACQPRF